MGFQSPGATRPVAFSRRGRAAGEASHYVRLEERGATPQSPRRLQPHGHSGACGKRVPFRPHCLSHIERLFQACLLFCRKSVSPLLYRPAIPAVSLATPEAAMSGTEGITALVWG